MKDKRDILKSLDYYKAAGTTYEEKFREVLLEVLIDIRDILSRMLEEK